MRGRVVQAAGKRWVNAILYLHSHATDGQASSPSNEDSQQGASSDGGSEVENPREPLRPPVGECICSSVLARDWKGGDSAFLAEGDEEEAATRGSALLLLDSRPRRSSVFDSNDMAGIVGAAQEAGPSSSAAGVPRPLSHDPRRASLLGSAESASRRGGRVFVLSPRRVRSNDWGAQRRSRRKALHRRLKRLASSGSRLGEGAPFSAAREARPPLLCTQSLPFVTGAFRRPPPASRNSTGDLASFPSTDKIPRVSAASRSPSASVLHRSNAPPPPSAKRDWNRAVCCAEPPLPMTPSTFLASLSPNPFDKRGGRRRGAGGGGSESGVLESRSLCSGGDCSSDVEASQSTFVPVRSFPVDALRRDRQETETEERLLWLLRCGEERRRISP